MKITFHHYDYLHLHVVLDTILHSSTYIYLSSISLALNVMWTQLLLLVIITPDLSTYYSSVLRLIRLGVNLIQSTPPRILSAFVIFPRSMIYFMLCWCDDHLVCVCGFTVDELEGNEMEVKPLLGPQLSISIPTTSSLFLLILCVLFKKIYLSLSKVIQIYEMELW